ncbi:MAG: DNA-binding protein, partial [Verrucomicrobiota bacterium]|nr:DNA-binding protein [Verrucomicrobiota bacterium]
KTLKSNSKNNLNIFHPIVYIRGMYYSKCNVGYVIRLEIGEEIQESLRQFAEAVKLKGGFYVGIGAVTQVELGFFRVGTKQYDRRFLDDNEYELVSLTGNLSLVDDLPTPHTHVAVGDSRFQTYSGHLVRAVVSVTAEILVTQIDLSLTRKEDPILSYHGLISPHRRHLKVDS